MRLIKTKKRIDFDICLRNIHICTFHYGDCSNGEWENWTEIKCWYECDCENCPLAWESRSYEGECEDCGCFFDHDFNVPKWKCMLPRFIKKIYLRRKERRMIYIITAGEYSDYHIIAATTDKESAEKIAEHFNADIEEFEDATPRVLEVKHYQYRFTRDGVLLRDFVSEIRDYEINSASYVAKNCWNEFIANVYTDKPKDVADKIAYDLLASARAKEAGI